MDAQEAILAWVGGSPLPEGWEVDVDDGPEGGQPNGVGTIESSDAREWFSPDRESHHRERLVITVIGPWTPGARVWVESLRDREAAARALDELRHEDAVLRHAERIKAKRASIDAHPNGA
jgi:hypothetical protein